MLREHYDIVEKLGEGGFAKVYLAVDRHSLLKRKCVIKKLRRDLQPENYEIGRERFYVEAQTLESINHPQIPKYIEFFEDNDELYLVEEFIDGDALGELIKQKGKLPQSFVIETVKSLLQVLAYIHSQKYIHRDIKPSNLIIRQSDELPILLDFGTVKEIKTAFTDEFGTSGDVSVMAGTEGYKPLEQHEGKPVFNSDLYALAKTAIYCLTAKPPKFFKDPVDGKGDWEADAPGTDSRFAAILNKACERDYRLRFLTAQEMLDAIISLEKTEEVFETQNNEDFFLPEFLFNEPLSAAKSNFGFEDITESWTFYSPMKKPVRSKFEDSVLDASVIDEREFFSIEMFKSKVKYLPAIMLSLAVYSFTGFILILPVLLIYNGSVDSSTLLLSGAYGSVYTFFFYRRALKDKDKINFNEVNIDTILSSNFMSHLISLALFMFFALLADSRSDFFKPYIYENKFSLAGIWMFLYLLFGFLGYKLMFFVQEKDAQMRKEYYAG